MTNASSSSASLWPFVRFAPVSPCDCCNRWTQNWTWDARFDLTKVEWKIPVTSHKLPWHYHSCLVHPMLLAFFPQVHITSAWSTYCPPSAFLQSCFTAGLHSVCTGYYFAPPFNELFEILAFSISQDSWGPFEWQHNRSAHQSLLAISYCL